MCICLPGLYVELVQVNGTACAIPRLMIAILENYQQSVSNFLLSTACNRIVKVTFVLMSYKFLKNVHCSGNQVRCLRVWWWKTWKMCIVTY